MTETKEMGLLVLCPEGEILFKELQEDCDTSVLYDSYLAKYARYRGHVDHCEKCNYLNDGA